MGFAIATELIAQGHEVVLIAGPTVLEAPQAAAFYKVETAQEMYACPHHN